MLLDDLIDTYDASYIKPAKAIYDELINSNVMSCLSVPSAVRLSAVIDKIAKLSLELEADNENVEEEATAAIEAALTDLEKATLYGAYLLCEEEVQ